jgi:hypothetical protein
VCIHDVEAQKGEKEENLILLLVFIEIFFHYEYLLLYYLILLPGYLSYRNSIATATKK